MRFALKGNICFENEVDSDDKGLEKIFSPIYGHYFTENTLNPDALCSYSKDLGRIFPDVELYKIYKTLKQGYEKEDPFFELQSDACTKNKIPKNKMPRVKEAFTPDPEKRPFKKIDKILGGK